MFKVQIRNLLFHSAILARQLRILKKINVKKQKAFEHFCKKNYVHLFLEPLNHSPKIA